MLKTIVYTCILHIRDVFDEMLIMAGRGPIKGLFKYLHLNHCLIFIFML